MIIIIMRMSSRFREAASFSIRWYCPSFPVKRTGVCSWNSLNFRIMRHINSAQIVLDGTTYTRYVYVMRKPLVFLAVAFVYLTCTCVAQERCDGRERSNVAFSIKEIMWKAWFLFIFFARLRPTSTLDKFNLFFGAIFPLTCTDV